MSEMRKYIDGNQDVAREAAPVRNELSDINYATQKATGFIKALDQIDNKRADIKKNMKDDPGGVIQFDRLSKARADLVQGMSTPQMLTVLGKAKIPNGDLLLKAQDPFVYEILTPSQQQKIQQTASDLNAGGRQIGRAHV